MDFNSISNKVISLIAESQNLSPDRISLDTSFEELDIDSLRVLSLVSELEDEFDIFIPNEELSNIKTIRQVVDSLEKVLPLEVELKIVS